jgi:hypothetical protein
MSRLDEAIVGGRSKDKVEWSDGLRDAFKTDQQKALSTNKTITLPRADDMLWIITDGAVRNPRLGATIQCT